MISYPHQLRVADDASLISCHRDPADLNRPCVDYRPCGHLFDGDFDAAIATVDGARCDQPAATQSPWSPHHLWVRQRALVTPTSRCKLAEALVRDDYQLVVVDPEHDFAPVSVPPGDWPIAGYRFTRDHRLEIALTDPLPAENSSVLSVA